MIIALDCVGTYPYLLLRSGTSDGGKLPNDDCSAGLPFLSCPSTTCVVLRLQPPTTSYIHATTALYHPPSLDQTLPHSFAKLIHLIVIFPLLLKCIMHGTNPEYLVPGFKAQIDAIYPASATGLTTTTLSFSFRKPLI